GARRGDQFRALPRQRPGEADCGGEGLGGGRYIVVGGAGSLEVAPGVRLVTTANFPPQYKAEAEAGGAFLDLLRREKELNWTFLSPSALFVAGERTGKFRLGGDQLLAAA